MKRRKRSKEEWLAFEWPGMSLHQGYTPGKAWWYDFPKFGAGLSKMAVTHSRGTMSYYVIRNEFEGNGRKFFEKVKARPEIMLNVLEEANRAAEKIFSFENRWKKINFAKLSDKELIRYQKELFHWDEILWRKGQIQNLLEMHNNFLSTYIRELIEGTFRKEKIAKYFQILSASDYKSKSEKQDEDFTKLVESIKSRQLEKKKIEKLIKNHSEKYTWMLYGWIGPALDEKYFHDNLEAAMKNPGIISDIKKRKEEHNKIRQERRELLKKFSAQNRKLALLLRKLLEAKVRRVDAHSLTYFIGDKIHSEIARRNFLSMNQLRAIPPKEIPRLFQKADPHQLNAEYDYVMYWYEKGRVKKLVGEMGKRKFKYIAVRLPKIKATNVLKGEMAYMGKASGKARVILEVADFPKFRKGEILVTRMTDPSYVPLMKISRAVVTDIGGITCHASIVSRELKKPCVIGTKIGTKVIRDGNLLKVEADKGIVRIIK